jgi:hypothetical protein
MYRGGKTFHSKFVLSHKYMGTKEGQWTLSSASLSQTEDTCPKVKLKCLEFCGVGTSMKDAENQS